jgi:hypothetical protein
MAKVKNLGALSANTPPREMTSWNDLPYEIRATILRIFAEEVVDEYFDPLPRVERSWAQRANFQLGSLAPAGPLTHFRWALTVSKDFFGFLSKGNLLHGENVLQVLRRRQGEILDVYNQIAEDHSESESDCFNVSENGLLLPLRTAMGHIWKDLERAKEDLAFIEQIFSLLNPDEGMVFLASLQTLFGSTSEIGVSHHQRVFREGAPCFSDDMHRHRMIFYLRKLWEKPEKPGTDYNRGIYQISCPPGEASKNPKLPCCQDLWNEIARSEGWWTVFWYNYVGESDLPRVLVPDGNGVQYPREYPPGEPCYFIHYEKRIFYRVGNGTCERLDHVWDDVPCTED